jgi:hypothetical protein
MFTKEMIVVKSLYSNFAMPFKGNFMGELNQLMLEHEEFLEEALDCMEYGGELLTQAQVDCIRQACGKPNRHRKNPVLTEMFNDFGTIFGGNHA